MNRLHNIKKLTAEDLYRLLAERLGNQEKRLQEIPLPHLLKDSQKAAKRVADAIANGEKITIIGDYDVDGTVSTSIMVLFFKALNYPITAIIPNRFTDGYGINEHVLQRVDADLIITVDNGISALAAAKRCRQRGIDLIITDHHTPSSMLPDAYAVINPKREGCSYPFKEICGAQVAWLFLGLVKKELGAKIDMKQYLDLVALAIIADVMPLQDINRLIVKEGLKQMARSSRPSSIIIQESLNKGLISSEDVAFFIAPRINSAGRLEDASIALEFLTASDIQTAARLFDTLTDLNNARKQMEADAVKQAAPYVKSEDKIIVAAGEDWHEGVIGIVASRLVGQFQKPAIVFNIQNEIAKGSGRSIANVDLFSLIDSQRELLDKFGGHKMAAGLSLRASNIDAFRTNINRESLKIDPNDFIPCENILGELQSDAINMKLLDLLEKFEPYGEANPRPRFLIKEAKLLHITHFGADKSHSRLTLQLDPVHNKVIELIAFRQVLQMPLGCKITCSYTINKNIFNNKISMQFILDTLFT